MELVLVGLENKGWNFGATLWLGNRPARPIVVDYREYGKVAAQCAAEGMNQSPIPAQAR